MQNVNNAGSACLEHRKYHKAVHLEASAEPRAALLSFLVVTAPLDSILTVALSTKALKFLIKLVL